MNATARSLLQTVLSIDAGLDHVERVAVQRLLEGRPVLREQQATENRLLITQKEAARQLSVSRVTAWRLVREGHLTPAQLPNGMTRYSADEVALAAAVGRAQRVA